MATIAEMASRGATKMSRKEPIMARNWDAAKTRMIAGYEATPLARPARLTTEMPSM